MLWLVDGSGGESHLWMFSRNWFSEMMRETQQSVLMRLGDDERLT
jgi:hypothetical protein